MDYIQIQHINLNSNNNNNKGNGEDNTFCSGVVDDGVGETFGGVVVVDGTTHQLVVEVGNRPGHRVPRFGNKRKENKKVKDNKTRNIICGEKLIYVDISISVKK